jgi:hypothetical protein
MGAARNVARTSIEGKRRKRTEADNPLAPLAEELDEVSCAVEHAGHLAAVLENHLFYTDEGPEVATTRGAVLVLRGHLESTARRCFDAAESLERLSRGEPALRMTGQRGGAR